eukprot:4334860-Pleurochrysis_carterae.AAC.1
MLVDEQLLWLMRVNKYRVVGLAGRLRDFDDLCQRQVGLVVNLKSEAFAKVFSLQLSHHTAQFVEVDLTKLALPAHCVEMSRRVKPRTQIACSETTHLQKLLDKVYLAVSGLALSIRAQRILLFSVRLIGACCAAVFAIPDTPEWLPTEWALS